MQDSDGEAGIALVGVHSDFPKYEVNILLLSSDLPHIDLLIHQFAFYNIPHIWLLIHALSSMSLNYIFSSDNIPHLGHWNENTKKDSLYFLRYGANPNDEKCPNSTGGATVG